MNMTNNGGVANAVETEPTMDFSQFDFTNEVDVQDEPEVQEDGLTLDEGFSFDEIDDESMGDEATDPSFNHNKEEIDQEELFDEEEVNEFEAEQEAGILDTVAKVADNWNHIPEDTIVFDGMTKAEVQEAMSSKQDNSLYNQEFNNFKAHVDEGYYRINEILFESMSEAESKMQEIQTAKSNLSPHDPAYHQKLGLLQESEAKVKQLQQRNRGNAAKAAQELTALKEHSKKQEMINFAQSAKREYGAQWVQEVDKISEGLPQSVLTTLKDNPSVEMFNLIRDAKAHRAKKAANQEAVKSAGKKMKTSAKSVRSNQKGTAPVTGNKAKAAKAFQEGKMSAVDAFDFITD